MIIQAIISKLKNMDDDRTLQAGEREGINLPSWDDVGEVLVLKRDDVCCLVHGRQDYGKIQLVRIQLRDGVAVNVSKNI